MHMIKTIAYTFFAILIALVLLVGFGVFDKANAEPPQIRNVEPPQIRKAILADPCNYRGRVIGLIQAHYIEPKGLVAAIFIATPIGHAEVVYQHEQPYALEYDLVYNLDKKAVCKSSDVRLISVNSFRQFYGKEAFDKAFGKPL